MERRGLPDDVAAWIVLLASDVANWITGQVITAGSASPDDKHRNGRWASRMFSDRAHLPSTLREPGSAGISRWIPSPSESTQRHFNGEAEALGEARLGKRMIQCESERARRIGSLQIEK